MPEPTITHLERRKIEGGVLIPMVQAFQRAIGKEQANEVAREVIIDLARRDGERWAEQFGDLADGDCSEPLPDISQETPVAVANSDPAVRTGFGANIETGR